MRIDRSSGNLSGILGSSREAPKAGIESENPDSKVSKRGERRLQEWLSDKIGGLQVHYCFHC
jgi:hypothetical protein